MEKDRAQLREEEPEVADDIETAEAKSGSVDERVPDEVADETVAGVQVPAPASHVPQSGIAAPGPATELEKGPGEIVLERERKAQRAPKQRG